MSYPQRPDIARKLSKIDDAATHQEVRKGVAGSEYDPASCPLGLAINTIGGRWKLHILRMLILDGPHRYNAMLRSIDGISPKELTRNLRELESAGLVKKTGTNRVQSYALTTLGAELDASFRALGIFGSALAAR